MSERALPKLTLTIPEVCESTGFEEWRVKQLIKDGTLPSVKIGRGRFVRMSDLERYINSLETSLPEPDSRVRAAVEGRRRKALQLREAAA